MMRRLFTHKGVIGLSALLLVVAVGAVAWAAPGDDPVPDPVGPALMALDDAGFAPHGGWGPGGRRGGWAGTPEEFKERLQERHERMQQRREAFLDLVRDKMSAEDQAELDRLTAQAEQQREALEKAREALGATNKQIHDLVGEYFPLDPPADGGAGSD